MKLFLDHDVPTEIAGVLRRKGFAVLLLRERLPRGAEDQHVLEYAAKRGMILVTCNRRDFLPLAETEPHAGMIILIRRRTRVAECAAILRLLEKAGEAGISKNINFA